jgi:hypothetical protein
MDGGVRSEGLDNGGKCGIVRYVEIVNHPNVGTSDQDGDGVSRVPVVCACARWERYSIRVRESQIQWWQGRLRCCPR